MSRSRSSSASLGDASTPSSSWKSISASSNARTSRRAARNSPIERDRSPRRCPRARSSPRCDRAVIISCTASAWARSRRPLRNARRVNSPGSAGRAPARRTAVRTSSRMRGPPWQWISSVSSPVKERGARMKTRRTSSRIRPVVGQTIFPWERRWERRGFDVFEGLKRARPIRSAPGPLARTMPMPPVPGGVAIAAMVSAWVTGVSDDRGGRFCRA